MFKFLREKLAGGDKKALPNLTAAFVLGIALIIFGGTLFKSPEKPKDTPVSIAPAQEQNTSGTFSYEEGLEKRLKTLYESVEGAGKVSVMLTLSYGKELVIAQDAQSQRSDMSETDSEGGHRETHSLDVNNKKIVIKGEDGITRPIIVKEIEPKVEGVIIVAQGGDNIIVVDALIRATQTVLGIESHKVSVLKMKDTNKKQGE